MKVKQTPKKYIVDVIKTAAITMKQLNYRESQAMTAIVTISCVKFCPNKGFWPTIYFLVTD